VMAQAAGDANPSRAFSYRKYPELVTFAESRQADLTHFGYGPG